MEAANRRRSRESARLGALFSSNPIERRQTLKSLSARIPGRFLVFFLYNLLFRFCFLDGRRGMYFVLLKTFYEFTSDLKALGYDHSAIAVQDDEIYRRPLFRTVATPADNARADSPKALT
jgi:hypothetical protein